MNIARASRSAASEQAPLALDAHRIQALFATLTALYDPGDWWPAATPFEVMVGAILTQNTAWTNVERALAALRQLTPLEPAALLALDPRILAATLRPTGYYNLKTERLRACCAHVMTAGGLDALAALDTPVLRQGLLAIPGVGRETADDMLLYAFRRPVFVVDAYTRRLGGRLGLFPATALYEAIRAAFERALGPDVAQCHAGHALIVEHGKQRCRSRPRCGDCPLWAGCLPQS